MPSLSSDGARQDIPLPGDPPPKDPPPNGPSVLHVRDLDVAYGRALTALRGVCLEVPAGGAVALLGANGAGKSTLLRSLSGTLRLHRGAITAGSVHYGDVRLTGQDPVAAVRAGVVQVPEGRRVFAGLTVDENLRAGGLGLGRRAPAVVKAAREQVFGLFPRLAERRAQRAGLLSGGEQQMLAIGRALMAAPRLLLLDEPSLGLAPLMVERIAEVIREINAQGTSILLVEQNAAMALALSDHAYVLEVGEVRLAGPAAELARTDAVRRLYLGEEAGPEAVGPDKADTDPDAPKPRTAPTGPPSDSEAGVDAVVGSSSGPESGVDAVVGSSSGPESGVDAVVGPSLDPEPGAVGAVGSPSYLEAGMDAVVGSSRGSEAGMDAAVGPSPDPEPGAVGSPPDPDTGTVGAVGPPGGQRTTNEGQGVS